MKSLLILISVLCFIIMGLLIYIIIQFTDILNMGDWQNAVISNFMKRYYPKALIVEDDEEEGEKWN